MRFGKLILKPTIRSPIFDRKTPPDRLPVLLCAILTVAYLMFSAISPLYAQGAVDPRSGQLQLTQTDLIQTAGAINLEVKRTLTQYRATTSGLLGTGWRLSWEKQLARLGSVVIIDESDGPITYHSTEQKGRFTSFRQDSLVMGKDGTAVRNSRDGSTETFDARGRLIERVYPNGTRIIFTYRADGKLERVDGPRKNHIRCVYAPSGELTKLESSDGHSVLYGFNDSRLVEVRINGGPALRYAYGKSGRLAELDDPQTGTVSFRYDDKGRVAARRWPDGSEERFEYVEFGRLHRFIMPSGAVFTLRWSEDGKKEEKTGPDGAIIITRYDANYRPVSIVGPEGASTNFSYDDLSRNTRIEGCCGEVTQIDYLNQTELIMRITHGDGTEQVFEYDAENNLTAIKEGKKTVTSFSYYPDGLLKHMGGTQTTEKHFTYHANGKVASEANALGDTTRFEYDNRGNLIREIHPNGGVTTRSWDAQNRLIAVTDAAGARTRFDYDDRGFLVKSEDPEGGITRYSYDSRGRMQSKTDPVGNTTRFAYDGSGRLTNVTNPMGQTSRYGHDAVGRVVRETNPLGGHTDISYDSMGRVLSIADGSGFSSKTEYTPFGQIKKKIGPLGGETAYEYNSSGRMIAEIDPVGRETRFAYDEQGRVLSIYLPSGLEKTFDYDKFDNVIAEKSNHGLSNHYEYDVLGRLVHERRATGLEIFYTYNYGNLVNVRNSTGDTVFMVYDDHGRMLSVTGPIGEISRFRRDLVGRVLEKVDALGHAKTFTYNAAGDLTQIKGETGPITKCQYDSAGQLRMIRHPRGGTTRYTYDGIGNQLTTGVDPGGSSAQSVYSKDGRLVRFTNKRGQTTQFIYDRAGRLVRKEFSSGKAIQFAYNASDNLVEADDGVFPVRFSYDEKGRLKEIDYPKIKRKLYYSYDDTGLLIGYSDLDGNAVRYGYDTHKRLSRIWTADRKEFAFEYDDSDRMVSIAYPNDIKGIRRYDVKGRVTAIRYTDKDENILAQWAYTYDLADNLTEIRSHDGSATRYRYDAAGQIAEESVPEGKTTYRYGPEGNRIQKKNAAGAVDYRYDLTNQLVAAGNKIFQYDADGNLVESRDPRGSTRYEYDSQGQLVKITTPDGKEVSFGYSPSGQRIWRKDPSGLTWFVSDGVNLIAELDGDLKTRINYLHLPGVDQPLAMAWADQLYYYHAKTNRSIAFLSDSAGKVATVYKTDAFGAVSSTSDTVPNPFIFNGRVYDRQTGLYHFRARYYDPSVGRFMSADPVSGSIQDPRALNPYLFVLNNPNKFIDPFGTREENDIMTTGAQTAIINNMPVSPAPPVMSPASPYTPMGSIDLNVSDRIPHEAPGQMHPIYGNIDKATHKPGTPYMPNSTLGTYDPKAGVQIYSAGRSNPVRHAATIHHEVTHAGTRHMIDPNKTGTYGTWFQSGGAAKTEQISAWQEAHYLVRDRRVNMNNPEVQRAINYYRQNGGDPRRLVNSLRNYGPSRLQQFISGPPGRVSQFMQQHGGKVALTLTALQLANCKAQGKSVADCAKELAAGYAVGTAIVTVVGPTGAIILAAGVGGYHIYQAGVEAVQQWQDYQQRTAAYDQRQNQSEQNRQRIAGLISALNTKIESQLTPLADQIKGPCAALAAVAADAQKYGASALQMAEKIPGVFSQADQALSCCANAASINSELETIRGQIEGWANTLKGGSDTARTLATNCSSPEEAERVKAGYDAIKGLHRGIVQKASLADTKAQAVTDCKNKAIMADAELKSMPDKKEEVFNEANKAHKHVDDFDGSYLKPAEAANNALEGKCNQLLGEINALRGAMGDDTLLAGNEAKFSSLRGVVESFRSRKCDAAGLASSFRAGVNKGYSAKGTTVGKVNKAAELLADLIGGSCTTLEPKGIYAIRAAQNAATTKMMSSYDVPILADICADKVSDTSPSDASQDGDTDTSSGTGTSVDGLRNAETDTDKYDTTGDSGPTPDTNVSVPDTGEDAGPSAPGATQDERSLSTDASDALQNIKNQDQDALTNIQIASVRATHEGAEAVAESERDAAAEARDTVVNTATYITGSALDQGAGIIGRGAALNATGQTGHRDKDEDSDSEDDDSGGPRTTFITAEESADASNAGGQSGAPIDTVIDISSKLPAGATVTGVSATLSGTAYNIKDQFQIIYQGSVIADSGVISGGTSLKGAAKGSSPQVVMRVIASKKGTKWNWSGSAKFTVQKTQNQ